MAALDVVERWLKAESAEAQNVTTSDAVRQGLLLAAATIEGSAKRDEVRDAVRDAARDAARRAQRHADDLGLDAGQYDALMAQLKATERAYRGFDSQVQRIGNNVNQLAIVANSRGTVDSAALAGVARALRAIEEEMVMWERFDNRERMRLLRDR